MTEEVVSYGIIPFLVKFTNSTFINIRKHAVWNLSNIAAGTKGQIRYLIQMETVPVICGMCHDPNKDVVREAVWFL
jgi:hypothetical protein